MTNIVRVEPRLVCYCGHPVARHELPGTPYARCRLWHAGTSCNCAMGAKPIIEMQNITSAGMRRFQRTQRGWDGSALMHALGHHKEFSGEVRWLITSCERCHQTPIDMWQTYKVYPLDVDGITIMRRGRPRVNGATINVDTGKYIAICELCDIDDESPNMSEEHKARTIALRKLTMIGYKGP